MAPLRATAQAVTGGAGQMAGQAAAQGATHDWEVVRASAQIQFTPLPQLEPRIPQVPGWLQVLGRFLEAIFGPLGRLLGMSWPVFQWVLLTLAVVLALFALWRIFWPLWASRADRAKVAEVALSWSPSRAEAEALLGDADRLAAQGNYGEATRLLLRRSVQQIHRARPEWLHPASTAREIACLPQLPEPGRRSFAIIAERVERSLFALRELDGEDWRVARSAYAQFAALEFPEGTSPA